MTRRDSVSGERGPRPEPVVEEAWFPPGGAPPVTVSPTRPLGRRPAAIPEAIVDRSRPKASGVVRLPLHIAWSPPYEYDLADRRWLRDAYQRILTEGTEAGGLWYIDIDVLLDEWAALHLSPHIRSPWARWLSERGLLGAGGA